MAFTLQILEEFLCEEGFSILTDDDLAVSPHQHYLLWQTTIVHLPEGNASTFKSVLDSTVWRTVVVSLRNDCSCAIELSIDDAFLFIWTMKHGLPINMIATIPLADPECFEKLTTTLRGLVE